MSDNNPMNDNNSQQQNAVSVYGQEGLDDFPVLKAFQQYIDAEQAKSRKRMLELSIGFVCILAIVVTIFLVVLGNLSSKNQKLNDKLFSYVLQDRDRLTAIVEQPTPSSSSPQQTAAKDDNSALKVMTEMVGTLQKQVSALEQTKSAPAPQPQPQVFVPANAQPTPEQAAIQRKIESDTEKLRKAQRLIQAEKDKLAAERERLRQEEIDLHRRRLYPEYYEKLDAEEGRAPARATTDGTLPPTAANLGVRAPARTATESAAARTSQSGAINYFDVYGGEEEEEPEYTGLTDEELDALPLPEPTAKSPATTTPATTAKKTTTARTTPAKTTSTTTTKKTSTATTKKTTASQTKTPAASTAKPQTKGTLQLEIDGEDEDWFIPED